VVSRVRIRRGPVAAVAPCGHAELPLTERSVDEIASDQLDQNHLVKIGSMKVRTNHNFKKLSISDNVGLLCGKVASPHAV
jgi:hypothetical protein